MIIEITDNLVKECIDLMSISYSQNEYSPYDYNERCWIEHLTNHVKEQGLGNPRYLAIADYDEKKGYIKGFMLASAFVNFYTQEWVMDVKDCIVDHDYNNAFTVTRLFNHMIAHTKAHGGSLWRADSIRANDKAEEYTEFLKKKYNAVPFHGVHGRIE
jgi:hypothetical protein